MAKWKTLAGTFSPNEYEVIKEYLDKNQLKENQLVQKAIKFYVPFFTGVNVFQDPKHSFWQEFMKEIEKLLNSKEYRLEAEKIALKLLKKYSLEDIQSESDDLAQVEIKQKELEKEHKSVGRPKKIRTRGRPRR